MEEKTITIDLKRCFVEILKKWYLLLLCAVVLGGGAFLYTDGTPVTYAASASIFSEYSGNYQETVQNLYVAQTYLEIITSSKVSERAEALAGGDITAAEIAGSISTSYSEDSTIIWVQARSLDPERAVRIVNAVAESFVVEARSMTGKSNLQVLDRASRAVAVDAGTQKKYTLIAALAGLFIPAVIIFFIQVFSDSVYHVEDAELGGELQILGIIPYGTEPKKGDKK